MRERRLVHQVDGLVRQLAVGDVAMGKRRRGNDCRIGDLDAVVHGVAFLQSAQDRDRVLDGGLADEHFLEAAFERGVLLDVLAVFVERRRADAVQLAARERGLEHVACIHRAFGLAGADHRVQFVDEQDDVAFFLGQILQDGFQALLEFAAKLRAGDQRAHVERQHAPVAQAFGHLVIDDALGQTLDDRRLADAGFADQHRVVLRAPLQHLDHAADFLVAADDRIELGFLGERGQVDRVLLQRLALLLGIFAFHFFTSAHPLDRGFEVGLVRAGGLQGLADLALVVERGEHEQLAGDERIAALLRQLVGDVQQPGQVVRDVDVAFLALDRRQLVQRLAQARAQRGDVDAGLRKQRRRGTALLVEQRRHQVHRFEHVVVAPDRQRLGVGQCLLEARSQFVHPHECRPQNWRGRKAVGCSRYAALALRFQRLAATQRRCREAYACARPSLPARSSKSASRAAIRAASTRPATRAICSSHRPN